MFKLTITKGNDVQTATFREYWQALTTAIRAQNAGYTAQIEKMEA
jgi:hypothetical protein